MSDNKLDFNLDFLEGKSETDRGKYCSKCGEEIKLDDTFCSNCGNKVSHSVSETENKQENKLKDDSKSSAGAFYAITNTKLIVLTVLTLGIYEIYWFYKQWQSIKKVKNLKVTPWARGLFAPLFAYPLFKHIFELAKEAGEKQTPSAGWLAVAYFIFVSLWRLPEWYWLISFASFWPLIPVQNRVNSLWSKENPKEELTTHFSGKEVIAMIIGGIILVLAFLGGSSGSS